MNLYIVTGTTKGLGAALVEVLLANPDNFVATLSRAPTAEIGKTSPVNVFFEASKPEATDAAFAAVVARLPAGPFKRAVLINNAGVVMPVVPFNEVDAKPLVDNLNINVATPMLLTRFFAQALRGKASERLVINISSGAAKRAIAGWSAYCTAKAALEMATRVAALEAGTQDPGLAICSLAPGVVDTPMQTQIRTVSEHNFPDVARFKAMKAEGALRNAHDVAKDIVRLIDNGRLTNGGNFDIRELS
jgi:benzil reductase ((S)-benzoin forming)